MEKFLAVAKAGKIVAAADRLAVTRPALTRAIARIESRFGAPLFERPATGARPPALGPVAAEQARRFLRAFEEAEDRIGGALAGRTGCIRALPGGFSRGRAAAAQRRPGRGAVPAGNRRQRPALRRHRHKRASGRPSEARAAARRRFIRLAIARHPARHTRNANAESAGAARDRGPDLLLLRCNFAQYAARRFGGRNAERGRADSSQQPFDRPASELQCNPGDGPGECRLLGRSDDRLRLTRPNSEVQSRT